MKKLNIPESSNIAAVRYDEDAQRLEVDFKNGGATYEYYKVPKDVAEGFETAESAGKYFHANIVKGGYGYKKL